ncbi:hypothetical protein AK812_SmicGene14610 [Symbiodinium microadriaticum]|uniref:Uncharacterized protein n=1 Tax=Symbiodinium microadriaticum TaxID=2951 RepID=A0A1Q9E536_SYMMI|nr:hypothetical protein AK812_SmicGene14610 [Symbiodinium microadriaticum]
MGISQLQFELSRAVKLERTRAQHDDAILRQLVAKGNGNNGRMEGALQAKRDTAPSAQMLRFAEGAPGPRGTKAEGYQRGGYAEFGLLDSRGQLRYGLPVARRTAQPERPRGAMPGRAGARRGLGLGAGRGGLSKVNTNIIEDRAKDDLQEENLQLRRTQAEMKSRLQKLQTQIRGAREDPWEAKALEQKAADLEQLQRALSAPGGKVRKASTSPGARRGLRSRQQSQRTGGGRLRGRMTVMPWEQAFQKEERGRVADAPARSLSPPSRCMPLPAVHVPASPVAQSPCARLAGSPGSEALLCVCDMPPKTTRRRGAKAAAAKARPESSSSEDLFPSLSSRESAPERGPPTGPPAGPPPPRPVGRPADRSRTPVERAKAGTATTTTTATEAAHPMPPLPALPPTTATSSPPPMASTAMPLAAPAMLPGYATSAEHLRALAASTGSGPPPLTPAMPAMPAAPVLPAPATASTTVPSPTPGARSSPPAVKARSQVAQGTVPGWRITICLEPIQPPP